MDYRNQYLQMIAAMRKNRETGAKPISDTRRPGLAAKTMNLTPLDRPKFDPQSYMEDIQKFFDDMPEEKETLRPKARPEELTVKPGLKDGVSLTPQSRGDLLTRETGVRLMADLMSEFDLTKEQAAAFVGNLAQETGDFKYIQEIDPVVEGSRGGYGVAQWTGPRRKNFERWSEEQGLDPASYEANWGYLKKELTEADETIGEIGINTIAQLKEKQNLEEATRFISDYFLRPGTPHMDRRIAKASGYMEFN